MKFSTFIALLQCLALWQVNRIQALVTRSTSSIPTITQLRMPTTPFCDPPTRQPIVQRETSSRLLSSLDNSNNSNIPGRNKPSRFNFWKRLRQYWINRSTRLYARYQAMSKRAKRLLMIQGLVVAILLGGISRRVMSSPQTIQPPVEVAYSSFLDLVEQQQRPRNAKETAPILDQVRIGHDRISYRVYRGDADPESMTSYLRAYTRKISASPELVQSLRDNKITFAAAAPPRTSSVALVTRTVMVAFYFVIVWRLYGTIAKSSGGGKGETPGKLAKTSDLPLASFDDIQGIDGAKNEVMELVDTLRNPDKYAILGARAPTGLLLEGPPGVGKTLLARATAASAGVPLLYCSGSDFVEMFVGRGAARVRKLFERATRLSPCLIFIDELDALGKSRDMGGVSSSFSRSNDEAEQTLNQLLACMDGLDSSRQICVMAATNRKEVLDPALIRPGRFDRIVSLQLPDATGREKILRVHCQKLPGFAETRGIDPSRPGSLGKGRKVDLSAIAAVTDGLSGAELEFVVNEAAIRAVRRVSAALLEGAHTQDIVPHVEAADFEASLASFFETRRKQGPGEILKNLLK